MAKGIIDKIRKELNGLKDEKYRLMQCKIIPNIEPDSIIGVRTPELRKMAKQILKHDDADAFLSDLPHKYFEENQLHAFMISEIKDYDRCVTLLNAFLPYVNNWATCDQMSPKVFKKHHDKLPELIRSWMGSKEAYTIRFGIGMLMEHFLDEEYDPKYPEAVAGIRSEEYYVNMMIAWYFATALAKQYESVLPFIEGRRLDTWTHNKAIQKSIESYRISDERKAYLKTLKYKGNTD